MITTKKTIGYKNRTIEKYCLNGNLQSATDVVKDKVKYIAFIANDAEKAVQAWTEANGEEKDKLALEALALTTELGDSLAQLNEKIAMLGKVTRKIRTCVYDVNIYERTKEND